MNMNINKIYLSKKKKNMNINKILGLFILVLLNTH